jgi:hypothetical protein
LTTRAALAVLPPLADTVARRGSIEVQATNAGVEAGATVKLFETKWLDGDFGVTASTRWARLDPKLQALFKIRFW